MEDKKRCFTLVRGEQVRKSMCEGERTGTGAGFVATRCKDITKARVALDECADMHVYVRTSERMRYALDLLGSNRAIGCNMRPLMRAALCAIVEDMTDEQLEACRVSLLKPAEVTISLEPEDEKAEAKDEARLMTAQPCHGLIECAELEQFAYEYDRDTESARVNAQVETLMATLKCDRATAAKIVAEHSAK